MVVLYYFRSKILKLAMTSSVSHAALLHHLRLPISDQYSSLPETPVGQVASQQEPAGHFQPPDKDLPCTYLTAHY